MSAATPTDHLIRPTSTTSNAHRKGTTPCITDSHPHRSLAALSPHPSLLAAAPGLGPVARAPAAAPATVTQGGALNIDFATYNPLSLVIKDQGWLESCPRRPGHHASTGSSRPAPTRPTRRSAPAPSTSARRPARRRCWPAPTARPSRSSTSTRSPSGRRSSSRRTRPSPRSPTSRGKHIAATNGTDPYFFLLQALEEAGVPLDERDHREPPARRRLGGTPERLRRRVGGARPDHGRRRGSRRQAALPQRGLQQLRLPERHRVVPRRASRTSPRPSWTPTRRPAHGPPRPRRETAQFLADESGLDIAIATKVITERSNLDVDPVPGDAQMAVLDQDRAHLRDHRRRGQPGRRSTPRWRRSSTTRS